MGALGWSVRNLDKIDLRAQLRVPQSDYAEDVEVQAEIPHKDLEVMRPFVGDDPQTIHRSTPAIASCEFQKSPVENAHVVGRADALRASPEASPLQPDSVRQVLKFSILRVKQILLGLQIGPLPGVLGCLPAGLGLKAGALNRAWGNDPHGATVVLLSCFKRAYAVKLPTGILKDGLSTSTPVVACLQVPHDADLVAHHLETLASRIGGALLNRNLDPVIQTVLL